MDKLRQLFQCLSLIMALSSLAEAQEVRNFFSGIRMMGMGEAGIAIANDETALLENPAGLGKLRDFYGTLIDPELEGDIAFQQFETAKFNTDPENLAKVQPQLDSHPGTNYHAKEAIMPSVVTRNFGFGVYYRRVLDAQEDAAKTNVTANLYDDMAILLGTSVRLLDGRIKIGVVGKFIDRISIENATIPVANSMSLSANASEGAGIGLDSGIIITAPWVWLPTISAVLRDGGGTRFTAGSGLRLSTSTRPSTIAQDYDVALALFPIHGSHTRSSFTLEYDKLVAASKDTDKNRYYHVGWELNFSDLIFLRLGMNQRYWTAGLELASERFQWQLASYGEDIGQSGSPVEDRRYMFKFSFRF